MALPWQQKRPEPFFTHMISDPQVSQTYRLPT